PWFRRCTPPAARRGARAAPNTPPAASTCSRNASTQNCIMRRQVMGLLVFLMLASIGAPAGVVIRPVANMYSRPSDDADVVSQAIYGSNVTLTEHKENWIRVRTADQYEGFLPASSLRRADRPYAADGRVAQVKSLFANLYREASVTTHAPLLTAPFETKLEVVTEPETENRRWIQVRLPDDRPAWVQRGDITLHSQPLSVDDAIALSKRFLGDPYLCDSTYY